MLSRRVSIDEGPLLPWVFPDFLGSVLHLFLRSSLVGGLLSFFFAVGLFIPFVLSLLLSSHFVSSVLVACLRCVFLWLVSSRPRDVVFVSMVHLVGVFAGI